MKIYFPNFPIRRRYFDGKFCAKTHKEAADRMGCSTYHLKTYVTHRELFDNEQPFDEFWVKPYGYASRRDLGDDRGWMLKEAAEAELDEVIKKIQQEWEKY